jgi:hypothetical protein
MSDDKSISSLQLFFCDTTEAEEDRKGYFFHQFCALRIKFYSNRYYMCKDTVSYNVSYKGSDIVHLG